MLVPPIFFMEQLRHPHPDWVDSSFLPPVIPAPSTSTHGWVGVCVIVCVMCMYDVFMMYDV